MKNIYAQVLYVFAWLLMIAGTIGGVLIIEKRVGTYGEIVGIALIFASIFQGVLYLTIAKISYDLTQSVAGNKKMALFPFMVSKVGA